MPGDQDTEAVSYKTILSFGVLPKVYPTSNAHSMLQWNKRTCFKSALARIGPYTISVFLSDPNCVHWYRTEIYHLLWFFVFSRPTRQEFSTWNETRIIGIKIKLNQSPGRKPYKSWWDRGLWRAGLYPRRSEIGGDRHVEWASLDGLSAHSDVKPEPARFSGRVSDFVSAILFVDNAISVNGFRAAVYLDTDGLAGFAQRFALAIIQSDDELRRFRHRGKLRAHSPCGTFCRVGIGRVEPAESSDRLLQPAVVGAKLQRTRFQRLEVVRLFAH